MRFFENGPSIPDELLIARDEGRVVFFCGAGVSRARAGLSDFFGLAGSVIRRLGVSADSPACKILHEAQEIDKRTGVNGLISADRIFGLLERDFLVRDIESAVAKALQPSPDVDLSAHRILLDLATTPEGNVQLVTTNFDRLFDECNGDLQVWQPPRLPDPSRHNEMDGIVYLHGCTNKDYSGSEGDGFILSSSEFGRAYLSDGWATTFFREIVDRYFVVFIGYSADDPPVQYLLEALNKREGQLSRAYAFQAGLSNEADARWRHKGIEAIAYAEENGHPALWETLAAWAVRAKAPEEWYQSVIDLARKGPENLQPHERGQVAHIISTLEGARKFSEGDSPPPANWLCVFDPYQRYVKPRYRGGVSAEEPFVDPFDIYGLDSDIAPAKIDPDDHYTKREVPASTWDAFAANRLDRQNLQDDSFSALRGHWASNAPRLPSRLNQIGVWIRQVVHQPASVWWAASQTGLHPDIQSQIKWTLESSPEEVPKVIRQAWRYLFEAWDEKIEDFNHEYYELKARTDKDGWDSVTVRKYAAINRPYLKAEEKYWGRAKPSEEKKDLQIGDLLNLCVEYPEPPDDVEIPDEFLAFAIRQLRKNLEHALQLESELGGYGLSIRSPIVPYDGSSDDNYERTHGLTGCVISFSTLFERLVDLDVSVARQEFASWPVDDDTIFSRLRIWASGKAALVSSQAFGQVIMDLSNKAFWNSYHQRDFLLVLAARWKKLQIDTKKEIEDRLLQGRVKWDGEKDDEYEVSKAWTSLNCITWLANSGCNFTFDLDAETKRLRCIASEWQPEYAANVVESREGRGGFVKQDTEYSTLLHEPLSSTLSKALELSGRTEDFLVEKDPYAGLSAKYPVRAFSALTNVAKRNEYPEWAWSKFLYSEARNNDKAKFSALIAERITRFPNEAVTGFVHPLSAWFLKVSDRLAPLFPNTFDTMIAKLINVIRSQPAQSGSAVVQVNKGSDWSMEAINAPTGKIAQALFKDPRKDGLATCEGFPTEWIAYVNDLLSFDGNLRRHALVIFAHNLCWFYEIDPDWAEDNLLSVLDSEDEDDRSAVWCGFFWRGFIPNQELYIRMKPNLLALAMKRNLSRREDERVLAGIILAGWGSLDEKTGLRCISNDEMRDVLLHANDDFRSRILWHLEMWPKSKKGDMGEKWTAMLPELLREVWPRQISAKTPTISARLCDLAFSNVELFPVIAEIILPLLTTYDHDHLRLPNLRKSKDTIVDLHPHQTLALLHAILPDNVTAWPYNIDEIFQRISETDSSLNSDERLIELKRKWNAR